MNSLPTSYRDSVKTSSSLRYWTQISNQFMNVCSTFLRSQYWNFNILPTFFSINNFVNIFCWMRQTIDKLFLFYKCNCYDENSLNSWLVDMFLWKVHLCPKLSIITEYVVNIWHNDSSLYFFRTVFVCV